MATFPPLQFKEIFTKVKHTFELFLFQSVKFSYFLNRGLLKSFIMRFDGVLLIQILVLIFCLIKSKQKQQRLSQIAWWTFLKDYDQIKKLALEILDFLNNKREIKCLPLFCIKKLFYSVNSSLFGFSDRGSRNWSWFRSHAIFLFIIAWSWTLFLFSSSRHWRRRTRQRPSKSSPWWSGPPRPSHWGPCTWPWLTSISSIIAWSWPKWWPHWWPWSWFAFGYRSIFSPIVIVTRSL